jgi:hypothetical protein
MKFLAKGTYKGYISDDLFHGHQYSLEVSSFLNFIRVTIKDTNMHFLYSNLYGLLEEWDIKLKTYKFKP